MLSDEVTSATIVGYDLVLRLTTFSTILQLSGWWQDVVSGQTSYNFAPVLGMSSHSVGNLVMKRSQGERTSMICLDGQQRLTTASILAAVFRDEAYKELKELDNDVGGEMKNSLEKLIDQMDSLLFLDVGSARKQRY